MVVNRKVGGGLLVLAALLVALPPMWAQGTRPLTEENLTTLLQLRIDDSAITSKLKQAGITFVVDDATVERLKKAGASEVVITATRGAPTVSAKPVQSGGAITYQDVLKLLQLGVDEQAVMKRLEKSPTLFLLDSSQVEELKQAGATETLLKAMQQTRSRNPSDGPKVTDFAIVLDCSGSMGEQTRDGQVKIDVAKQVVSELISKMPEKLRVTFVIYGYDRDLNCQAVQVSRPLSPLDFSGKSELISLIGSLRPVANTPIALALETAGHELAKNDAPCGLILLTDGKETCGGNPAEVASALARRLNLSYGVNVIGFDVQNDERESLAEIARAGKGKYYNAQNAAELIEIVRRLQKELEIVARPAPTANQVHVGTARLIEILPPAIQLPQMASIYLTRPGVDRMAIQVDNVAKIANYAQNLRIPPTVKLDRFDLWWAPEQGRAIKMIKELAVDETTASIKLEEHLGLLRLTGKNLPGASAVLVTPVGTASFATRAEAVQSASGYGKDLIVAPGQYDVWIEPSDGGKSEKVAEKVDVTAGKATVIN
jgi:hypothetical protein